MHSAAVYGPMILHVPPNVSPYLEHVALHQKTPTTRPPAANRCTGFGLCSALGQILDGSMSNPTGSLPRRLLVTPHSLEDFRNRQNSPRRGDSIPGSGVLAREWGWRVAGRGGFEAGVWPRKVLRWNYSQARLPSCSSLLLHVGPANEGHTVKSTLVAAQGCRGAPRHCCPTRRSTAVNDAAPREVNLNLADVNWKACIRPASN
ncbi:hypothetical protein BKA70DRAFT_519232 [Coprinopsis sp. MPI-PUGE-AT-0042]|nr:hypothetical protein BKA70DRAFT_519232 [Coprinopsis sp. MPI-PUGE-AT-0042]